MNGEIKHTMKQSGDDQTSTPHSADHQNRPVEITIPPDRHKRAMGEMNGKEEIEVRITRTKSNLKSQIPTLKNS